jgi:hypothetical protein
MVDFKTAFTMEGVVQALDFALFTIRMPPVITRVI